jgi:hypothetical protein
MHYGLKQSHNKASITGTNTYDVGELNEDARLLLAKK